MKCLYFFCTLLLHVLSWSNHYRENNTIVLFKNKTDKSYYLQLFDGLLHRVPDVETLLQLNLRPSSARNLPPLNDLSENSDNHCLQNRFGEPTVSLKPRSHDYDEVMRVFIELIDTVQYPLHFFSDIPLGFMINPALALWFDRLVLLAGPVVNGYSQRGFHRISAGFAVLNNETYAIDEVTSRSVFKFAFNLVGLEALNGTNKHLWQFNVEDARMMVLPDNRLLIVYNTGKIMRLCITKITLQHEKIGTQQQTVEFPANNEGNNSTLLFEKEVYLNSSSVKIAKQKNWSPFLYELDIFYIYSIQPWRIVKVLESTDDGFGNFAETRIQPINETYGSYFFRSQIKTVHFQEFSKTIYELGWHDQLFGAPRGGSPAILLPGNNHYLTIFHTRIVLKGNVNYSYMMGAVCFCSKPPFLPYSISNVPIVHKSWYTGPWAARQLDYIVYPMAILLQDMTHNDTIGLHRANSEKHNSSYKTRHELFENKVLLISMGRQDRFGHIVRIGLDGILRGMRLIGPQEC